MKPERNPKGAGRKPLPDYLKKTKLHDFRLPKWVVDWLLSHKGKGSLLLEEAIINYFHLNPQEEYIMQNAIREIINGIDPNHIFDSHFIINELIKNYSDEYLQFAAQYATDNNQLTLTTHGQIGKLINNFNGELIERQEFPAWSENIHGKGSPCTCWRKL